MNDLKNTFAVILAGGSGTRFWPKSRKLIPKQLCKIGDNEKTMLELTLERLDGFIPPQNRIIITHKDQGELTKQITKGLCDHVLLEPEAKNTAAALALGAFFIEHELKSPDAMMISLHADHRISPKEAFIETIKNAITSARNGFLTLVGITPSSYHTGYGYIEKGDSTQTPEAFKVKSFKEKPDQNTAKTYVDSKQFLWNSGLFIWQTKTFLKELETYLPKTFQLLLEQVKNNLNLTEIYSKLENIAVDNAVLEKSKIISVVETTMHWQDVGSWDALREFCKADENNNLILGQGLCINSTNILIDSPRQIVTTLGVKDLVIAITDDAILICHKDETQNVKNIVSILKAQHRGDLI